MEPATKGFYKVPRRFDLATVFVVTFAYAACFGVLNAFESPVPLTMTLMGGLTLVAIAQMFVSERYARLSAIACGWAAFVIGYAMQFAYLEYSPPPAQMLVSMFCSVLIFGSLMGYVCGTVVAGVFLIADYVRRAVRAVRERI